MFDTKSEGRSAVDGCVRVVVVKTPRGTENKKKPVKSAQIEGECINHQTYNLKRDSE